MRKYGCFKCDFTNNTAVGVNLLHTNLARRRMSSHQSNFNYLCNTSMQDISLKEWRRLYFYNLQCLPFGCYALSPFIWVWLNNKIANECNTRSSSHSLSNDCTVPTCYELAVWTIIYPYFVTTVYLCDLHHYVASTLQIYILLRINKSKRMHTSVPKGADNVPKELSTYVHCQKLFLPCFNKYSPHQE